MDSYITLLPMELYVQKSVAMLQSQKTIVK